MHTKVNYKMRPVFADKLVKMISVNNYQKKRRMEAEEIILSALINDSKLLGYILEMDYEDETKKSGRMTEIRFYEPDEISEALSDFYKHKKVFDGELDSDKITERKYEHF